MAIQWQPALDATLAVLPLALATAVALLLGALWLHRRGQGRLPARLPVREVGGVAHVNGGRRWGLRIVCVSDTHGLHRELELPEGDVLVHAGDFTQFGKEEHVADFNAWLGEQPHGLKLVVLGNHENSSPWNKRAESMIPHATVLRQSSFRLAGGPSFFGTDFFWPCKGRNPYFDQIPDDTDVLIAHGPARGCADGGKGCGSLLEAVRRVRPALVLSGHIHFARGAAELRHAPRGSGSTVLVNAANCGSGKQERRLVHGPVVIEI